MARETSLWNWLSKARFYYEAALHMHRIENTASPGMPDVEGYLIPSKARQFWIEQKSEGRPAKPETPIHFEMRPKQIEWLRRRWKLGGAAYWLLQVGSGTEARRYLLIGNLGKKIDEGLTEAMISELSVCSPFARPETIVSAAANRWESNTL